MSQLCFADNTPPDANVVEGLLRLVIGRSSEAPQAEGVTFNTDCIDHTPAIRVVLLRLLLQSRYASNLYTQVRGSNLNEILHNKHIHDSARASTPT